MQLHWQGDTADEQQEGAPEPRPGVIDSRAQALSRDSYTL